MRKFAFTLAEVLLTLAIIGVVAALTIPAVITKVQQDQYVVGLKKAYNTLKSVEREAIQDHGDMANWDWAAQTTAEAQFNKYFRPHFDILKDCGTTTDGGCFAAEKYAQLNSNTHDFDYNVSDYYKILTSDGIAFGYVRSGEAPPAFQAQFHVDINGPKKPNKWGRDLFVFNVFPSSLSIKPHGTNTPGTPEFSYDTEFVNDNCSSAGSGTTCVTKVLSEGAMNY